MKCRNCEYCVKVEYTKWNRFLHKFIKGAYQECWKTEGHFMIADIDAECDKEVR